MIQLLVVDDDEINIFLLKHLLRKSPFPLETVTFSNPVEALTYIRNPSNEHKKPDLLLLDINMPQMTGWDFLHDLEAEEPYRLQGTLIYMLSSSVHAADNEKAVSFPEVSGFISKPVTLEFLTQVFEKIKQIKQEGS